MDYRPNGKNLKRGEIRKIKREEAEVRNADFRKRMEKHKEWYEKKGGISYG